MEAAIRHYTPEEYLEMEHRADYRSEYINGQIYAMADASREHNDIAAEIFGHIWSQTRGGTL